VPAIGERSRETEQMAYGPIACDVTFSGVRNLLNDDRHGANVRDAIRTLVEVTIANPSCAPGVDVCADLDQLSTALFRAFELESYGDLNEKAVQALDLVGRYVSDAGLGTFPHCEGCGSTNPPWSDELARALQASLTN